MIDIVLNKSLHGSAGRIDLSFQASIKPGSFATLFGPSGVGKTTILRMLAGLTVPDSGRITVDGEVWFDSEKRINIPTQHRSIGLVFQDHALFPHLTVLQNLAYGAEKGKEDWVAELLEATGLVALKDRLPEMLSGGQKQRVALARALARKPRLLLLDEPLSALDVDLRVQLQDTLLALHRRLGMTTLMVSHDLGEVFKLAENVLCIDQGKIVQAGTPAEVFLHHRPAGRLYLSAQVLEIRREEVVYIVSLLIGNEIVEVVASADEAEEIRPGEVVSMAAKSFSPLIFKRIK